jgi:hypothetical protein
MLGFDSLTCVTKGNILGNISLHTVPSISGVEIMVHLIPSGMNGISGLMSLTQHLILQLLDVRHTNPPLVLHALSPRVPSSRFFFLDVVLYLLDLLIFQLASPNLLK